MSESKQIPEWLRKAWKHYSRAGTFDVDMAQWLRDYPNLREVMDKPSEYFEALAIPGTTLPDGVTPALVTVRIEPKILEALKAEPREKPGPKSNNRQLTIEDKAIDLRNRANFDLLDARIEDVENVAQSYLHQFRIEGVTKGQRRRLICELHRVMLLRGKELSRPLYESICLRLGMPLPADFWTLPAEMLPRLAAGVGM